MSTFVDVPGVGEVEFPDTMSQGEITAAVRRMVNTPSGSTGQAVAAGAGEQLYGNAIGLLNLPAQGMNALTSTLFPSGEIRTLGGLPGIPVPQFQGFDLPTGRQLTSAVEAPVQSLMTGASIPDAYASRMDARESLAQDRPAASAVGGLLGDAATIASGRAPLVRGPGGLLDDAIRGGLDDLSRALTRSGKSSAARRTADRFITSEGFRALARGAGRAAETGIEGAALSILQGGDPLEVAAYSAGGQAASSIGASFFESATNALPGKSKAGKVVSATAAAFTAAGLVQLLKSATPGGDDNYLESLESGFNKVAAAILIGGAVGVLGTRTLPDGVLREFPKLADALTTIPRTGIIKLAQAAAGDPEIETAITNAASGALTGSDARKFEDMLRSDDPVEGIRQWMEDSPRIRGALTAPDPRLANVPVTSTATPVRRDEMFEAMRRDTRGAEIASATRASELLARVLPRDPAIRDQLEQTGPRTFVGETLLRPSGADALNQLSGRDRDAVLEVLLADLIGKSSLDVEDGRVLDGSRLRARWEALPANVRSLYPGVTARAVESLFSTTPDQSMNALPPLLARALMTDGALAQLMRTDR